MVVVHSGRGGAGDAARIEQDAYDSVDVESDLGSDKRHNVHNWATIVVNVQSRRDRTKLRVGGGFLVDGKDDKTVA
jgi:hypothetical protein